MITKDPLVPYKTADPRIPELHPFSPFDSFKLLHESALEVDTPLNLLTFFSHINFQPPTRKEDHIDSEHYFDIDQTPEPFNWWKDFFYLNEKAIQYEKEIAPRKIDYLNLQSEFKNRDDLQDAVILVSHGRSILQDMIDAFYGMLRSGRVGVMVVNKPGSPDFAIVHDVSTIENNIGHVEYIDFKKTVVITYVEKRDTKTFAERCREAGITFEDVAHAPNASNAPYGYTIVRQKAKVSRSDRRKLKTKSRRVSDHRTHKT